MATVQAYAALDMTAFNFSNLANGDYYDGTSNYLDIYYKSGYADAFAGYGFTYSGSIPLSGTVTEYGFAQWSAPAALLVKISGLSIPMTEIVSAALTASLVDDAMVILTALSGRDTIIGSRYDDVLFGGAGNDLIKGGKGADTFLYFGNDGVDTIKGFKGKQGDMIDLRDIDANTNKGGDQSFKYIGKKKFKGKAGELRYDGKKLLGDTDGDKTAEFKLKLPKADFDKGDLFL